MHHAKPDAPEKSGGPSETYILFELAGSTYALPSREIEQLEMVSAVTPVPNAPPFVDGVVSVRGQVIPVVNLRPRFGFPRAPVDTRSRLVVVRVGGRTIGIVVDSAREFATISEDDVQPPPEGLVGMNGRYLAGLAHLGERLVLVLDAANLFDPDAVQLATPTTSVPPSGAGELNP